MPAELRAELSVAQVARFWEEGFLTLPPITSNEEVARLRAIFARLFAERAGREQGAQFDMVGHDDDDAVARSPQLLNPVRFAPELRETHFRERALAYARQLLGPETQPSFEHAILKPSRIGAPTPWHQDEASRENPRQAGDQLSIWMPLQPATLENGCMRFVPRSHRRGVLPHRSLHGDPRVHAIECAVPIDPEDVVPCPLPAGGATIHHGRTLHHAGANQSDTERAAYILAFRTPPRPGDAAVEEYPWMVEKRTARLARQRAAQRSLPALFARARRKLALVLK